ncbi:MAG: phosphomannomutase [Mariprofundaceae bacterium]
MTHRQGNSNIQISELMVQSGVSFGTSGARGLVSAMNDRVCYAYTVAFLQHLMMQGDIQTGQAVAIAGDLRHSTPRIMAAISLAIKDIGCKSINCGFIPTPALAYFSMQQKIAGIMVTGSHIPDDRNGIKFYKPQGEILKPDEQAICKQTVQLNEDIFDPQGQAGNLQLPPVNQAADEQYVQRYLGFFPENCLQGLKIGIYEHSGVARDMFHTILQGLGAETLALGRSNLFMPVDTEAIRDEDIKLAKQWAKEFDLDCIISSDGDADRPLISDAEGTWLSGDIAGILCARYLQAKHVITPISSNTAVEKSGWFDSVQRTRIGSPFVIEAMQQCAERTSDYIMAYEANGGFLTINDIVFNDKNLLALPTRDAMIVPLAILMLAKKQQCSIAELLQRLPKRFTCSGRLKDFPNQISQQKLQALNSDNADQNKQAASALLGSEFEPIQEINHQDGIRITLCNDEVIHLRASGNAPELRCYNEASSQARAETMNRLCLNALDQWRK